MLFHEIYGSYYQTVSLILKDAVNGSLTKKNMAKLIQEHAFGESGLSIPDNGALQLVPDWPRCATHIGQTDFFFPLPPSKQFGND